MIPLETKLATILLLATLLWATGAPSLINNVKAAALQSISDTLSDSDMNVASRHTIRFTLPAANGNWNANESIVVTPDPSGGLFTEAFSTASSSDLVIYDDGNPLSWVATCAGGAGTYTATTTNYNSGAGESLSFWLCPGTAIATSSVVTVIIGSTTPLWTNPNPGSPTSYVIRVTGTAGTIGSGGTAISTSDTRVAIIDDVTVTASIDSTFTFTVTGMDSTTSVNGTTTNITTTATTIPFGSLTPNTPKVASQRLNVTTNASHGFTVTVNATSSTGGSLVSGAGDDIDFFKDGARNSTPTAWTAPTNSTGAENTYGHFGVTSSDSTLSGGDPFGSDLWAGNFYSTTTREVFYHTVAADGTTADVGSTTVGYAIQVGTLQEAGTDYTTTLTYVATPIF